MGAHHWQLREVESAVDRGVAEQPGEIGLDEVQPAHHGTDFVEQLDSQVLVREVRRIDGGVGSPCLLDERRIGQGCEQREARSRHRKLLREEGGHVILELEIRGQCGDHPRLREVDGEGSEHVLGTLVNRRLELRGGEACGQRCQVGLGRCQIHKQAEIGDDECVPVGERVGVGIVHDGDGRGKRSGIGERGELGQLALQNGQRRVSTAVNLVVGLLYGGANRGQHGVGDLILGDARGRCLHRENVDERIDGEARLLNSLDLPDEGERCCRIGEGRVERPGSGQGDDALEVRERQLDHPRQRDDAIDEAEVIERELAIRQAEQHVCIGGRDLQPSLDGCQVMAQGGVRDCAPALDRRDILIDQHGRVEEDLPVERGRPRAIGIAVAIDGAIDVLEEGELLIDGKASRILEEAEREKGYQRVLIEHVVADERRPK